MYGKDIPGSCNKRFVTKTRSIYDGDCRLLLRYSRPRPVRCTSPHVPSLKELGPNDCEILFWMDICIDMKEVCCVGVQELTLCQHEGCCVDLLAMQHNIQTWNHECWRSSVVFSLTFVVFLESLPYLELLLV